MSVPATSIREGLGVFFAPGPDLVEVRILKTAKQTVSGYFDSLDGAVHAVERAIRTYTGAAAFYATLNPVNPTVHARAANRLKPFADRTTADAEILRRAYFLIDVDPVRPAGVSSTDAELALALGVRDAVMAWLSTLGWPEGLRGMSGNGGHGLYRIDLPNDASARDLHQTCLTALHQRFATPTVAIDRSVFNAARISKIYGTVARKGDATPDRPHRRARLDAPRILQVVTRAQLQALAAHASPAGPRAPASTTGRTRGPAGSVRLDMRAEFEQRGWYLRELSGGKHAVRCPWIDMHSGRSGITETVIFEPAAPDAVWGFKCQHEHCVSRTIRDVWELFRPIPQPPPADANTSGWPVPAAIQSALPPVATLSEDLLPVAFRPLVRDVTLRMQVPMDYPASAIVLCLAGVVSRRAGMQPKAHDTGWQVSPNLWGGIIAPPGFMKSPVIQATTRPLEQIQSDWRAQHDAAALDYGQRKEEFELRCAAWKELFKAATKAGRPAPAKPDDEPAAPTLRRLIVNDATFEALHQTMSENAAGVLVIRDELTGWLSQLDKPGREGERGFSLEAWNGNTGFTIDRIGRGTIHVEACCMSMLGGIQPGRLRSYLVDALKDGPSNDGLIQRFQVLVWPDTPADWTYIDRVPDAAAEAQIVRVFRRLVSLDVEQPARFAFAAAAQDLFVAWLSELETRIRTDDLHPALVSHLSKYRKLMPALALLFELADRAAGDEFDGSALAHAVNRVSLEHARQAAAWCDYLESHARRVYSCVLTPQARAARELAAKILARKVPAPFSCRDVYHNAWSGLDTPELVKLATDTLLDAGWLREVPVEPGPVGGRPSTQFDVNPRVWP